MLSLPLTDSGRYVARGQCVVEGVTRELDVNFRVLRQNGQLRIDGFFQAAGNQARDEKTESAAGEKHDFRLRLRFGTSILAGGRFEYADARFKQFAGTLGWAQDCYLLAGHCYAPNASISIHLLPGEAHNHYTLRGLYSPAVGETVSFALQAAPHDPRRRAQADALEQNA